MTPVLLSDRPTSLVTVLPEDATRREFITGVGAAALAAAFLAACGEDPADDPTATPTGTPATREVSDIFGTVTVPVAPQRVIVLGPEVASNVSFLGFPADRIAGIAWGGPEVPDLSHLAGYVDLSTVHNVGSWSEPDLELLTSLNPDLILSFGVAGSERFIAIRDTYLQTGIPVFTVHNGYTTLDETMRFLRDAATALNLEAKAAEEEAKLRARLDAVAARFRGQELPTVSTIRPFEDGEFWANSSPLLHAIGAPGPRPTPEEGSAQYSPERLSDVDADYIVVYGSHGDSPEVVQERMEASPLWASLSAVQEGRVRYVEATGWLGWNVPALYLGLNDIEAMLLGDQ